MRTWSLHPFASRLQHNHSCTMYDTGINSNVLEQRLVKPRDECDNLKEVVVLIGGEDALLFQWCRKKPHNGFQTLHTKHRTVQRLILLHENTHFFCTLNSMCGIPAIFCD